MRIADEYRMNMHEVVFAETFIIIYIQTLGVGSMKINAI